MSFLGRSIELPGHDFLVVLSSAMVTTDACLDMEKPED